jgi:hypothetical protein
MREIFLKNKKEEEEEESFNSFFYRFCEWRVLIFFHQIGEAVGKSFWTISPNWLTKITQKLFWWDY